MIPPITAPSREETVARAICVADGLEPDEFVWPATSPDAGSQVRRWQTYRQMARRMIAAFNACHEIK